MGGCPSGVPALQIKFSLCKICLVAHHGWSALLYASLFAATKPRYDTKKQKNQR